MRNKNRIYALEKGMGVLSERFDSLSKEHERLLDIATTPATADSSERRYKTPLASLHKHHLRVLAVFADRTRRGLTAKEAVASAGYSVSSGGTLSLVTPICAVTAICARRARSATVLRCR